MPHCLSVATTLSPGAFFVSLESGSQRSDSTSVPNHSWKMHQMRSHGDNARVEYWIKLLRFCKSREALLSRAPNLECVCKWARRMRRERRIDYRQAATTSFWSRATGVSFVHRTILFTKAGQTMAKHPLMACPSGHKPCFSTMVKRGSRSGYGR